MIKGAVMKDLEKYIEVVKKVRLQFKPDGIGCSCDCDACNDIRPTWNALNFVLCILEQVRDGKLVEPASKEEIWKIIDDELHKHGVPGYIYALSGKLASALSGHIAKPTPLVTAEPCKHEVKNTDCICVKCGACMNIDCLTHLIMAEWLSLIKSVINNLPDCAIEEAREIWGNTNTNIIKKALADCREVLLKANK